MHYYDYSGCLRMSSGEEKADFTLPGSPLDEYLRYLEQDLELNLFDQLSSDASPRSPDPDHHRHVPTQDLKSLIKSRWLDLIHTLRNFHTSQGWMVHVPALRLAYRFALQFDQIPFKDQWPC